MAHRFCLGFLLLVLSLPALTGCSGIHWERNYQAGLQQAMQQNRRALIQFITAWSPETYEMEELFADPEIQRLMGRYIPIRVDAVLDKQLADQYGVQVVPTLFVVRPNMTIAGSAAGRLDAEQLRVFLIKHSFD